MTGQPTSPPMTLASAPSMPATTMTAWASSSWSLTCRTRLSPATPTSWMRRVFRPTADATARASAATGESAVPADTTVTAGTAGGRRTPGH
jgi:hypothetical protein